MAMMESEKQLDVSDSKSNKIFERIRKARVMSSNITFHGIFRTEALILSKIIKS